MSFENSRYDNPKRYYFTKKPQRKMFESKKSDHPFIHPSTTKFTPSEYQLRKRHLKPHRFTVGLSKKICHSMPDMDKSGFTKNHHLIRIMGVNKESRLGIPPPDARREWKPSRAPEEFNKLFFGGNCKCTTLDD